MFAEAGVPVPHVAVAVPVVFTVRAEGVTLLAVARGDAALFATTMLTVMESPVLAAVPPPALAAVMLFVVSAAGLTELTVKLLVKGHELHVSPVGAVPFTETDMLPFVTVLFAVTIQSKVT